MLYIKVVKAGGEIVTAEEQEAPVYVHRLRNGTIDRCSEPYAEAIVSLDGSQIWQMQGRADMGLDNGMTAVEIYGTEYDEIMENLDPVDPEDDNPVIPEPDEGEEPEVPLTRAELTAKVAELEEQNAMLTECLLEMSEIVYG